MEQIDPGAIPFSDAAQRSCECSRLLTAKLRELQKYGTGQKRRADVIIVGCIDPIGHQNVPLHQGGYGKDQQAGNQDPIGEAV